MRWSSPILLVLLTAAFAPSAWAQTGELPPTTPAPSGTDTPPPPPGAEPAPGAQPPAAAPAPAPQPPPAQPPPTYPPGYPPQYTYPPGGAPPAYGPYPVGPGPGHPPGYGPPQPGPQPEPKPKYPDDAATQTSPFLDLLVAGIALDKRFDHLFNVGMQAGAYLGGRVRVAARFIMLTSEPDDDLAEQSGAFGNDDLPDGFVAQASDPPILVYGGSLGFAVVSRQSFAFSPGIIVNRTERSAYGTFLGMSVPFEWVTHDGARFGFEVGFGRGFGGEVTGRCEDFSSSPPPCDAGEERKFDRPSGGAFYAHFQFGWGFNHPEPITR